MTLPFPSDTGPEGLRADLAQYFANAHTQAFGYSRDDPVEVVSLRLRATRATRLHFDLARHLSGDSDGPQDGAYFGPPRPA